jgi:hypothetical protein
MKNYTEQEKEYIMSKIKDIRWEAIPDSTKIFWINWRNKNEES